MKKLAAIDYSISCPCICIPFDSFADSLFYYLSDKKKCIFPSKQFFGSFHSDFLTNEERFDAISSWAISVLNANKIESVYIEDYSFSSTGLVYHIGENAGLLKHKIWKENVPFTKVPPTVIKKHFSGKGNASKQQMYNAFFEKTNIDLTKVFNVAEDSSPISDVVDAYALSCLATDVETNVIILPDRKKNKKRRIVK